SPNASAAASRAWSRGTAHCPQPSCSSRRSSQPIVDGAGLAASFARILARLHSRPTMNAALKPDKERRLTALRAALGQGTLRSAHRTVNALHPAEIARLIESVPPAQCELVWDLVDSELEGEVLVE